MAPTLSLALLLLMVTVTVCGSYTCSSSEIQKVLGEYSQVCSGFFSEAFALTSEIGDYVHVLNATSTHLLTTVAQVNQVCGNV